MSLRGAEGLSLDQAPPLSIPGSFFVAAPLAMAAAGLLLLVGPDVLVTAYHPYTLALTHLGTLGVLAMVMFGAMYQMLPVVAGARVPMARLAHVVQGALFLGLVLVTVGLVGAMPALLAPGGVLAVGAALLFCGQVGVALSRAPSDPTVWGMRLAWASLLGLLLMGWFMGQGHTTGQFPGERAVWMQVHLSVALLGWVGGLLTAVSLKVVPMFYLSQEVGFAKLGLGGLLLGLLGAVAGLLLGLSAPWILLLTSPAALVVWVAHPALTLRALAGRKRKRADGSLLFWQAGLGWALLCGPLAVLAVLHPSAKGPLLLGWIAIWGWAGMILHGMLCRIAPFLVWFHRLSALVGLVPVPPMRRILPDKRVQWAARAHLLSVALGAVAIVSGVGGLARLTGLSVLVVAGLLGWALWTVFSLQAPVVESLD